MSVSSSKQGLRHTQSTSPPDLLPPHERILIVERGESSAPARSFKTGRFARNRLFLGGDSVILR